MLSSIDRPGGHRCVSFTCFACCFYLLFPLILSGCGTDTNVIDEASPETGDPPALTADPQEEGADSVATPSDTDRFPDSTAPSVSISDDAFRLAAEKGRVEKIEEGLSSGIDVDAADKGSLFTALHLAAHEGHAPVVRVLIEHEAKIGALAQNDLTPLHLAAYNGHTNVVELLLKSGAKVDARDREGKTPLTHACTGPFEKTVKVLLEAGADINAKEQTEGFTPLMMAAGLGQTEVVKVLLRNDVDKTIVDEDGDSALSHAQTGNHIDIIKLLE